MPTAPAEIALHVEDVSKDFKLPHEKANSIKSVFTRNAKLRGKKTAGNEIQHALRNISFEVKKGEFFGIVGRNGSGKSTLLKILAGIYRPTSGKVSTNGKLVPFIELGVGFNPELTGRENVYLNGAMLGFSEKEVDAMYGDIVAFAELERFMDQKLKNYSSGMQVRLAFSMATRSEADILLVDEVLAVGDADFQRKCFDYFRTLKKNKKTVVLVTHDMNAIREYCDRALMVEESEVVAEGAPDKVASTYTRLFMDQGGLHKGAKDKRWGDGTLTYNEVGFSKERLKDTDKHLIIKLKATAHKATERPIFGFIIKNATGTTVLGTNSLIEKQTVEFLSKGQSIELEWTVPNIFSDGNYYLEPAIVYKGGSQVADWWEESATFQAYTERKTPYIVTPPLGLKMKKGA